MADLITAGDLQWPLYSPCGDDGPDCGGKVTPDIWTMAKQVAIEWVWALSGRKFGTFSITFRPEWTIPVATSPRHYVLGDCGGYPFDAFAVDKPLTSAPLPGPVVSVEQVMVDGSILATSAYEVVGNDLVRVDGGVWPRFQDVTDPTTETGTWQVTYTRGVAVPSGGQLAAGVLACEEAKRLVGDTACQLPNNTSNVTRNGVTVNLDAKQPQMGFTTLRGVDQWVRTVNPSGRTDDPIVWSPDLDPNRLRPIPTSV